MKFFIYTSFINALSCGFCCLFVILNNRHSKTAQSFALLNSTIALWSFFYFLSMIATHYDEALFYSKTLNVLALFIPPTFLGFCIHITEDTKIVFKWILTVFLSIDIAIIPWAFSSELFIKAMEPKLFFPFWPVIGPLFYLSILQFLVMVPLAAYLLRQKINTSHGQTKLQLRIFFYSFLTAFLGGGTSYLLCFAIPIAPYGNILVPSFVIGFIFLISRYQIMNISFVLSRSVVYTIIIFLITLLYFLTTYLMENYLKILIGYKSFIFSFLCASITALAFIPFKDWLQNIIDKIFFRKSIAEIEQENKLLRQEVIQSERLRSIAIFASGMAHEIKNPLTPIKTFAEELPRRMDNKEFLTKFSQIIPREVERIDSLVQELLNYSKPGAPILKETDIEELLDQTLEFLNNDLIKNKISLNKDYQLTNKLSKVDPKQFKQALLNIILNAIDSMKHGGTLEVETVQENEFIEIKFKDSGHGISEEDLKHIFDPFFTKKDHGTGLGLSITHEIIRNHSGRIFVKSASGKGTTFIIQLPT